MNDDQRNKVSDDSQAASAALREVSEGGFVPQLPELHDPRREPVRTAIAEALSSRGSCEWKMDPRLHGSPWLRPCDGKHLDTGVRHTYCSSCGKPVHRHDSGDWATDKWLRQEQSVIRKAAPALDPIVEYRRGVREAFDLANMINANRQGRTAEETCSYIVRKLAELANNIGEMTPMRIAQELVNVQPMDPNLMKELSKDPLANAMLGSFVRRQQRKS